MLQKKSVKNFGSSTKKNLINFSENFFRKDKVQREQLKIKIFDFKKQSNTNK